MGVGAGVGATVGAGVGAGVAHTAPSMTNVDEHVAATSSAVVQPFVASHHRQSLVGCNDLFVHCEHIENFEHSADGSGVGLL